MVKAKKNGKDRDSKCGGVCVCGWVWRISKENNTKRNNNVEKKGTGNIEQDFFFYLCLLPLTEPQTLFHSLTHSV